MNLKDFGFSGGRRKTLVVLGAGASRGASFVHGRVGVLPPLDADFFQQLARMELSQAGAHLLEFVRAEYGHEAGLSMEQFFSEADYTSRFHRELNVDPGPRVKRYERALADFYEVSAQLLNRSTAKSCAFHGKLASLLHVEDTVLSFNYDCVMDRALLEHGGNRWDPDKQGYGFGVDGGAAEWCKHGPGQPPEGSITLLKMHGSMNWRVSNGGIRLLRPDETPLSLEGSIIAPTWFKNLHAFPYDAIWKRARLAVRAARIVVVVGYSVPQTDLFSRSLFKVEAGSKARREKLGMLVLVNPDAMARRKFLDLVGGGLEDGTRVIELDDFGDLFTMLVDGMKGSPMASM